MDLKVLLVSRWLHNWSSWLRFSYQWSVTLLIERVGISGRLVFLIHPSVHNSSLLQSALMHSSGSVSQTKHMFLLLLCSVMSPLQGFFFCPFSRCFCSLSCYPSVFSRSCFCSPLDISFSYAAHPVFCLFYNSWRLFPALSNEYTPYSTTSTKGKGPTAIGFHCC